MPRRFQGYLLLQEKWVLFIVDRLLHGPLGFNELGRQTMRVNTTTLTQRLELLESHGLVEKTIHSTMPPRTSYALTATGRSLQPVLEAIAAWSEQALPADPGACADIRSAMATGAS